MRNRKTWISLLLAQLAWAAAANADTGASADKMWRLLETANRGAGVRSDK